ncbi:hypothetical protein ACIBG8_21205 [Nonomuraea sp. NPDC050556]|uniref:hypothetical protein n=1 Tax=Nonomuraea sp. NPDC050556 TaxID=3364369 RepID=UPI0037BAA9AB
MSSGQLSPRPPCARVWSVGDLTPEELDELGPEPVVGSPLSWTLEEYKTLMLCRGIADACGGIRLGLDGYLELAEAFGVLEKRPNTLWVADAGLCSFASAARGVSA